MAKQERNVTLHLLDQLIHDIPVAILTTCRSDGTLHSRPMVNVNPRFDGDLWFFTHQSDPKVREIIENPSVNVGFASPAEGRYVSLSGTAWTVHNGDRARDLWCDACDRWFPKGLDDPQLTLLRVEPHAAEYWDETAGTTPADEPLETETHSDGRQPAKHGRVTLHEKPGTSARHPVD